MIGNRLKELRTAKALTIQQLCEQIGINHNTYAKYERNERDVSTETLSMLADFYGVTTDYLLGREEQPNPLATLNIKVNNDKFIETFQSLPDYAKEIFVETMTKLAEAAKKN